MKRNTKSSITLPPKELELVERLRVRLGAKSKVEVIRQGLAKLQEITERDFLKAAYRKASQSTSASLEQELSELDGLTSEGLDDE